MRGGAARHCAGLVHWVLLSLLCSVHSGNRGLNAIFHKHFDLLGCLHAPSPIVVKRENWWGYKMAALGNKHCRLFFSNYKCVSNSNRIWILLDFCELWSSESLYFVCTIIYRVSVRFKDALNKWKVKRIEGRRCGKGVRNLCQI